MPKPVSSLCLLLLWPVVATALDFEIKGVQSGSWFRKSKNEIELREYDSTSPPALVITTPSKNCRIDGKHCDAKKPIPLVETNLAPATHLVELEDRAGKKSQIRIHTLQRLHRDFSIEGVSALEKDFVAAPETYLLVLSSAGKLRYYLQPSGPVSDFRPHDVGAKRYYSYLVTERANEHTNSVGRRILLDEKFRPLETLATPMDGHEMILVDRDHYLYSDYFKRSSERKGCLIDTAVREFKKGKTTIPFSMVDFGNSLNFEPGPARIFEGEGCRPMGHLNSVQIVDAERWLLGLGEQVAMWNHVKSKAEWIIGAHIGEFEIPPAQAFKLVHTPVWIESESRLLVFDNGHYATKPPETPTARILDFKLDPKRKKVLSASSSSVAPGASSHSGGIVVDGNVVTVGLGSHKGPWDVREFKGGIATMSIRFGGNPQNYRVYRSQPFR